MSINTCACLVLTACCFVSSGYAAELVSPFSGSELIGEFQEDFGRFVYLSQKGDSEETVTTEGRLVSRLYRKPTDKGTFEVFRSYEKELSAAGFEILAVIGDDKKRAQMLGRRINRDDGNRMSKRACALQGKSIVGCPIDYIVTFIRPDSADTLDVIAKYLKENPKRSFYAVRHTDDQGKLSGNMQLSKTRAESSLKALLVKVPDAASRLSAHGVGPLSPVASN